MIDFGKIVAFARSELRLIRRLVRYWIFVVLACFFSIVGYLYYAVGLHMLFSSWSGSVSSINPRFIVGGIGLWFILIYCIGLVFIAFDIRARDRRERFFEVLDARPYRNLELVLGRFLGQLASGWIPMAIVWTGISILGLAIRAPIEPWSVFGMLTYMAIPAFSFTIGLTYVVTLLVRNRLIAGVLTLGLLVAQFVALIRSTLLTLPWFDMTGAYSMEFPSDIVTRIADGEGLLQRIGVTVVSLGLLVLAAGLYPRLERGKTALRLAGAGLAVVGIVAVGLVVVNRTSVVEQRDAWRAAHEAVAPETTPDVVALSADVDITGGRSLGATARMTIQPALDEPLAVATFSLNPGLAVSSVTSDGAGE
ncbi:MAG: hypothetical protein OEQ13_10190, partial [Acidobacteriota bacterium]|nr:hypothetical protein [Acidobacteriota bacterium]